jgi:hypothetical protein
LVPIALCATSTPAAASRGTLTVCASSRSALDFRTKPSSGSEEPVGPPQTRPAAGLSGMARVHTSQSRAPRRTALQRRLFIYSLSCARPRGLEKGRGQLFDSLLGHERTENIEAVVHSGAGTSLKATMSLNRLSGYRHRISLSPLSALRSDQMHPRPFRARRFSTATAKAVHRMHSAARFDTRAANRASRDSARTSLPTRESCEYFLRSSAAFVS